MVTTTTENSPGVWSPTAFTDIRSPLIPSFPHSVRCAYRFSQPLSALLLRTPSSIFQLVTPMGFSLQSFSPATSSDTLSGPCAIMPLARQPGPTTWLSTGSRSATRGDLVGVASSALLSWDYASPGDISSLHQGPLRPNAPSLSVDLPQN